MKFTLFDYQEDAVADLLGLIDDGWDVFQRKSRLSAVALSAPTAAGKTVIAASLFERLYNGDATTPAHKDLTVLWVTDDPSLNEQTRRKILSATTGIKPGQLVKVTNSLDQETFDRGTIYFVHIQQLGKGATSYTVTGDERRWSLWDTIGNTIAQRPQEFLLVVDEAHKGTKGGSNGGKTIVGRLTDGAGGAFPAAPVVVGITASPDNFIAALNAAGTRTITQVRVDPARVRASGLIKDKIGLNHPKETQPGDVTLLEMAVEELKDYTNAWRSYSEGQGEPLVEPILVVQVRAGASDKDLETVLATLRSSWSELVGPAVAHAFQDHSTLSIAGQSVRYIAPENIQDDAKIRAVLFKEALTTGWDCPRAEVLVSFRTAQDSTYISQLVGRMVRTPLAKRITTDDVLNTVGLYLPFFKESELDDIVKYLEGGEGGITAGVEKHIVACPRNPSVPESVWSKFGELPTYTRPARSHRSEVGRLNALALLLENNALLPDAVDAARKHIVGSVKLEATRLGSAVEEKVKDFRQIDSQRIYVDLVTGERVTEDRARATSAANIDDLFAIARRQLGDAAAKWYWTAACDEGTDPEEAKLITAAIATDPQVVRNLEAAASKLVDTWRKNFNGAITSLAAAKRDAFYAIWQQSTKPEQVLLLPKEQITAPGDEQKVAHHLYRPADSEFPVKLNEWEGLVVAAELAKKSIVAWYRNPTGGRDAIGVPYKKEKASKESQTMYPDFIFFHKADGQLVVDIVDPHDPSRSDCAPKWVGLAAYAASHRDHFRSVRAVIRDGSGQLAALDLLNPEVADRLSDATSEAAVRKVFDDLGGSY